MKKDLNTFSPKEVGVALNNAVQAALHQTGAEVGDVRLRKLRAYALALIEPLSEHIDEQKYVEGGVTYAAPLSAEEAVVILLSAALVIHMRGVLGSDKLPMERVGDLVFKQ